jgi:predicted O-methyltransferase YrrM
MLEKKLVSQQARFAVPFIYRGNGYFKKIEPRQNPFEIEELYRRVCALAPRRILEIGTARGGTLYLWTQAAGDDAIIVSVDLPGGAFGGAYPACRIPFYQSFARANQRMHLLRCNSHTMQTYEKVEKIFDSGLVDFIFIDGDHSYEGVKTDFQLYGKLVRPGGIIGFHDILPRQEFPEIQVHKFWKEISTQYDSHEIVAPDSNRRPIGIGLLFVGESGIKDQR